MSQEVGKHHFLSFRQKPESRNFRHLQWHWTPAFAGVTTFYESIKFGCSVEMTANIFIERDSFHGEWNYTISPNPL